MISIQLAFLIIFVIFVIFKLGLQDKFLSLLPKQGCGCDDVSSCGCDVAAPAEQPAQAADENQVVESMNVRPEYESANYDQVIKAMALESDIVDSHNRFHKDLHKRTSTASMSTITTHDNHVNPQHGFRRTKYNYGAQPSVGARVIGSERPDQLAKFTGIDW
jgi:hypothetical protein